MYLYTMITDCVAVLCWKPSSNKVLIRTHTRMATISHECIYYTYITVFIKT